MNVYKIVGLDRQTGVPRQLIVEAESERSAQNQAYESGIVIEAVDTLVTPKENASKALYSPVEKDESKPKIRGFFSLSVPFIGQKGNYEERGVNTVGEIAAGVFMGLLLFSCVSPIIFIVVMGMYWAWITSWNT